MSNNGLYHFMSRYFDTFYSCFENQVLVTLVFRVHVKMLILSNQNLVFLIFLQPAFKCQGFIFMVVYSAYLIQSYFSIILFFQMDIPQFLSITITIIVFIDQN